MKEEFNDWSLSELFKLTKGIAKIIGWKSYHSLEVSTNNEVDNDLTLYVDVNNNLKSCANNLLVNRLQKKYPLYEFGIFPNNEENGFQVCVRISKGKKLEEGVEK